MDSDSIKNLKNSIVQSIRNIRIEPNKTFRQVEVSESTLASATKFIKAAPNVCVIDGRRVYRYDVLYCMGMDSESIYELLLRDAGDTAALQADQKFQNWEDAVQHLLRYALYLLLAPRRPEFQSIKLYSSFYVYQVAKKLNGAEKVLMGMGYKVPGNRSFRDADELKIEGEVDLERVAMTAADLVILQCDLKLLKGNVKAIGREYPSARIADVLKARSMNSQTYGDTYEAAVGNVVSRLNLTQHSDPNITRSGETYSNDSDSHWRQAQPQAYVTGQSNCSVLPVDAMDDHSNNFDRRKQHIYPNSPMPPHSTPYTADGQNGSLLPRSTVGDQKHKRFIHHDSAPLLDDTSTRDPDPLEAVGPGLRLRLRKISGSEGDLLDRGGIGSGGNMSSRGQMQREGLWSTAEKRHTIGTPGIGTRSYSVGSPNDLEESLVAQTDLPPPNPDDLPAPIYEDEAAMENDVYQHQSHYSYNNSPSSDNRVNIFVQRSEFSDDTFEPLRPMPSEAGGLKKDSLHSYPNKTQQSTSPYNNNVSQTVDSSAKPHHPHGDNSSNTNTGSSQLTSDRVIPVPNQPTAGAQASEYLPSTNTPATSMDRSMDSNKPTKYIEAIVGDGFVNIDVVPGSPSLRQRSSHISESSRTQYEEKQKGGVTTPIAPEDLEKSNSESNLDVGKNLRKSSSTQWICDYCTFINLDNEECEVCGILRKKS